MQIKTAGEASRMLAEYENLNHDLPDQTKRWMAMFVIAPKVGIKAMEELFERPLGTTFFKHRSWMWYTAMKHSGLERIWYEFVYFKNQGISLCELLKTVRTLATPEEWLLFGQRLGMSVFHDTPYLNPYWYSQKHTEHQVWTKGGIWDRRNNYTRIIVLGERLTGRDHSFSALTRKLRFHQIEKIEAEVCNLVDENELLYPDAIDKAIEYVRWRLLSITGKRTRTGLKIASWFFQRKVPHPQGGFIHYSQTVNYPRRNKKHGRPEDWRWLP